MRFLYACQTDKGAVRPSNQDSLIIKTINYGAGKALLAAVCDGVGGLKQGGLASRRAAELLGVWADFELPRILEQQQPEEVLRYRLRQQLQDINKEIYYSGCRSGISSGTTLTALLLWDYQYLIGHAGDSRIYAIDSNVRQLTSDDSWIAQEVAAGRMTGEEAKNHTGRNMILKCIGAKEEVTPQIKEGRISGNTVFLLCTDGFWHYIEEEEWLKYFAPVSTVRENILGENLFYLTEQVKQRGESDNITAIAIRVL